LAFLCDCRDDFEATRRRRRLFRPFERRQIRLLRACHRCGLLRVECGQVRFVFGRVRCQLRREILGVQRHGEQ
jgi:hypothetical protein